jgi:hypothetical protein
VIEPALLVIGSKAWYPRLSAATTVAGRFTCRIELWQRGQAIPISSRNVEPLGVPPFNRTQGYCE